MNSSHDSQIRALIVEGEPGISMTAHVRQVPMSRIVGGELAGGDIVVRVGYSSVNYKDALAVLGRPGVVRSYPIIPGIDVVGIVERSADAAWSAGDAIVVNGGGLGERRDGGFAELAVVPASAAVPLPSRLTAWDAAAIGTAGYTAALSVVALEADGVLPEDGAVVVTGASGGVGSIAVALLAEAGYQVIASTGRVDANGDALRALGAHEVIDREELAAPGRPLQPARFAGGIDSVGGTTLANVLAQTRYGGSVTACGLAQSSDLPSTVMPFILRSVSLVGVDSVQAPLDKRRIAWDRLASALDTAILRTIARDVGLDDVPDVARQLLDGQVRGRVVVAI